jgi:hypothetical protein
MSIKKSMMVHPMVSIGTTGSDFNIQRVTNSTDYSPDQTISKDELDRLIGEGWTISISREHKK